MRWTLTRNWDHCPETTQVLQRLRSLAKHCMLGERLQRSLDCKPEWKPWQREEGDEVHQYQWLGKSPGDHKGGEDAEEHVKEVRTRLGFLSVLPKENIGTDQVPWLFVRSDTIRKRLTCLLREHHLPDL